MQLSNRSPGPLIRLLPALGATTSTWLALTHPQLSPNFTHMLLLSPLIWLPWRLLRILREENLHGISLRKFLLLILDIEHAELSDIRENHASIPNIGAPDASSLVDYRP